MGASQSRHLHSAGGERPRSSVIRARHDQNKQGPWEPELSYGEEADLHEHFKCCTKNPDHEEFISVDNFIASHLPPGYHNTVVDCVRAVSDLTVRVSVRHVSKKRPRICPGSELPYPCYSGSPKNALRVGTGWVCGIVKYPKKEITWIGLQGDTFLEEFKTNRETCTCKECFLSSTPKTQFSYVAISTAAHVVYDAIEGKYTSCHLFFDSEGIPEACSGVVTLSGMSDVKGNAENDSCVMLHVTHDLDLIEKLEKAVNKCLQLEYQVKDNSSQTDCNSEHIDTVVVSHPHGCSKKISIGQWTKTNIAKRFYSQYVYTTATCPGSSGAPVLLLGKSPSWASMWWMYIQTHSGNFEVSKQLDHSGNCVRKQQQNYSGFTEDMFRAEFPSSE